MDYFLSAREFGMCLQRTQRLKEFIFISDYVFFESSSTSPYTIRRIEELNKVSLLEFYFMTFCCNYDVCQCHCSCLRPFHRLIHFALIDSRVQIFCRLQTEMSRRKLCVSTDGGISPTPLFYSPTSTTVSFCVCMQHVMSVRLLASPTV